MAWARLDDKAHSHPKLAEAGLAGTGLYFLAVSYCADHLTDGFVPASWVKQKARLVVAKAVTDAGLWQDVVKGQVVETTETVRVDGVDTTVPVLVTAPAPGYFIKDHVTLNGSKATIAGKRKANRKRQHEWRENHREPDGTFSK